MEKYGDNYDDKKKRLIKNIKYDINEDQKFETTSFFGRILQRYRTPARAKLLAKATKRIEKELDLVKFV